MLSPIKEGTTKRKDCFQGSRKQIQLLENLRTFRSIKTRSIKPTDDHREIIILNRSVHERNLRMIKDSTKSRWPIFQNYSWNYVRIGLVFIFL